MTPRPLKLDHAAGAACTLADGTAHGGGAQPPVRAHQRRFGWREDTDLDVIAINPDTSAPSPARQGAVPPRIERDMARRPPHALPRDDVARIPPAAGTSVRDGNGGASAAAARVATFDTPHGPHTLP